MTMRTKRTTITFVHSFLLREAGRTLPAGISPRSLSEEDLISFWAADQMASASGTVPAASQP